MDQSLHHNIFTETGCIHKSKLLGYHHNTLLAGEKHQVEKHLLDCALCSDAQEGFALVPAAAEGFEELDADIEKLLKTDKSSFSPQWGKLLVAASIAGVLISTFFLFDYKDQEKQKNLAQQMPLAEEPEAEELEMEKTGKLQQLQKEMAGEAEKAEVMGGADGAAMTDVSDELDNTVSGDYAYDSRSAEVGVGGTEEGETLDLLSSIQPKSSSDDEANRKRNQDDQFRFASGAVAVPITETLKDSKADESGYAETGVKTVERGVKTAEEVDEVAMEDEVYNAVSENEKLEKKEIETKQVLASETVSKVAESRSLKKTNDKSKSSRSLAGKSRMKSKGVEIADAAPAYDADIVVAANKNEESTRKDRFMKVNATDYKIAEDDDKDRDNNAKIILADGEGIPPKYENEEAKKLKEQQETTEKSENTIQLSYDEVLKKGITEYDNANYTAALKQFDLILQQFPGDLNGIFYSGMTNYRLSRNEAAQAQLQQVIETKNTTFQQEAKWYQALTYEKMNDRTNARKSLKRIADEEGFYNKQAQEKLDEIK